MAMAPPPPPPPPPTCGHQPDRKGSLPRPAHAAIPYNSEQRPPVQETNPSPETLHQAEGAAASPPLPEQSGAESPPSQGQEDNASDREEKHGPVQETDPAPQMTEEQDEVAIQTDQTAEDQLS